MMKELAGTDVDYELGEGEELKLHVLSIHSEIEKWFKICNERELFRDFSFEGLFFDISF